MADSKRGEVGRNEGALNDYTCILFCRMPQMNAVYLGILIMKVCTACYFYDSAVPEPSNFYPPVIHRISMNSSYPSPVHWQFELKCNPLLGY